MDFDVLKNGSLAKVLIGESVYDRSTYYSLFGFETYSFNAVSICTDFPSYTGYSDTFFKVNSIKIFYVKYYVVRRVL